MEQWITKMILQSFMRDCNKIFVKQTSGKLSTKDNYELTKNLIETYTELIILQSKQDCGDVYFIEEFIEAVKNKCIIDYDGVGYFLDVNGNKKEPIRCDSRFLRRAKNNGEKFVIWYNK